MFGYWRQMCPLRTLEQLSAVMGRRAVGFTTNCPITCLHGKTAYYTKKELFWVLYFLIKFFIERLKTIITRKFDLHIICRACPFGKKILFYFSDREVNVGVPLQDPLTISRYYQGKLLVNPHCSVITWHIDEADDRVLWTTWIMERLNIFFVRVEYSTNLLENKNLELWQRYIQNKRVSAWDFLTSLYTMILYRGTWIFTERLFIISCIFLFLYKKA